MKNWYKEIVDKRKEFKESEFSIVANSLLNNYENEWTDDKNQN